MEKLGKFPRRVKLSYRAVAWLEDEIEAWIAARAAERDAAA
jgi:prophage regulatory protein